MVLEAIIDFVYPKMCISCGEQGGFLCESCKDRLDTADQICPMCGEGSPMGWTHPSCKKYRSMDGLIVLFEYKEPVMRSVVDGIKYGFNKELPEIVLKDFRFEFGIKFDMVVPVPLHFYRENWRGFNQAELLGETILSQVPGFKMEKVLLRSKNTKQQVLMKTREERENNIKGVFVVKNNWKGKVKGKNVLLVDDVFTSGADMRECTEMLKKSGVKTVWGLALAH